MIDFEEELKKFQPIPEVKEAEATIYERDLTDMVDILRQMAQQQLTQQIAVQQTMEA